MHLWHTCFHGIASCDLWGSHFLGYIQPVSTSLVTFFTLRRLDPLKFVLLHPGLDPSLLFLQMVTKLTQHHLLGCSSLFWEATFNIMLAPCMYSVYIWTLFFFPLVCVCVWTNVRFYIFEILEYFLMSGRVSFHLQLIIPSPHPWVFLAIVFSLSLSKKVRIRLYSWK